MKALLMAFGATEYHAACLAPILWAIVVLAAIYLTAGAAYDVWQHRTAERARQAGQQRRTAERARQAGQQRRTAERARQAGQQRSSGRDQDRRRCG